MSISRPIPLVLLCILYLVLAVVALWRTISTGAVDLFTLGVIPVLVGIVMRTSWSLWALRIYLFIQTLGLMAFATTALVALQITPQDVKLELAGRNIPCCRWLLCCWPCCYSSIGWLFPAGPSAFCSRKSLTRSH